jgi:hypothetical protein
MGLKLVPAHFGTQMPTIVAAMKAFSAAGFD